MPGSSSSTTPILQTKRAIRDVLPLGPTVLVQHDDAARLYDVASGGVVRELATGPPGHFERSLAPHSDGTSVVVTTSTQVACFDLSTGERMACVDVAVGTGAVVTATGKVLFIGRLEGAVVALFEWVVAQDPTVIAQLGPYHNAVGLTVSPTDEHVWLSLSTFVARVELANRVVWSSPREERCLDQPVVLASSCCVAIGSLDGRVQFWRHDEPSFLEEVRVGPDALHRSRVAALRGGALVAATAADQRISIVAPGDAQPRVRLEGPRAHLDVLVSDGARRLWAAVSDGSVWHFDVSRMEIDPAPKQSRKGKPTFRLTNHPTPHVLGLEVVAPGRAVSADLDGGLCSWVRGQDDARAYRRPKSDPTGSSKYAISHIAVAGKCIVVREGATGFLVLDAASLELVAKLPHKAANGALTAGTTLVSTGGRKLVQSFRIGTWEKTAARDGLGAGTSGDEWVDAIRAFSFRDERGVVGVVGIMGVDDLKTRMSRSFAPTSSHDATSRRGALRSSRHRQCRRTRSEPSPKAARRLGSDLAGGNEGRSAPRRGAAGRNHPMSSGSTTRRRV